MQKRLWFRHKRLFGALLASLVLHALATLFLPTQRSPLNNRESVQILTFSKTTKVNVERQSSPHRAVHPPALKNAAPTVAFVPRKRISTKPLRSSRTRTRSRRPAPQARATAPPSPDAVARLATQEPPAEPRQVRETAAPSAATVKPLPLFSPRVAQQLPPGTPAPTSQPAAVALSEGHAPAPGVGIFGESREALLNVKDRLELKKLLSTANEVVIVMDVSEEGKAIRVRSMSGVSSALRDDVVRRLLDASYIPQVCSGLPCDGQARIVFNSRGKE